MNQKLHERIWQFKLVDVETRDCSAYFRKRASEMAAALNCRLVAMSGVKVEHMRGEVRMVVGTALLENPRENVLAFPKSRHRPSS
jgi:hypothetical protein